MGNKVTSPLPNYDAACSNLNSIEIAHLKSAFLKLSQNHDFIPLQAFLQISFVCSPYLRKHLFPRFFRILDSKRDGYLDFEEYVSAIALFRVGTNEEKIKALFMMYEPTKSYLQRENLRYLLVDATLSVQKENTIGIALQEQWIEDMKDLSIGMVEMAMNQFSSQDGKLDFQEFVAFVKVESSIQGLLNLLSNVIDN